MAENEKVYTPNPYIDLNGVFLWQYESAEKIKQIIKNKQAFLKENVEDFWNNWARDVFNIDTANTFGLELWGRFLGVGRPSYIDGGQTIDFTDEQYRTVIKGRLMLMMSNGSVPSINKYLNYLFPDKPAFVVDYHNMSISIVFYYTPTPAEEAVIKMDGFLPRPAGVEVDWGIVPPNEIFGFDGQELSTFDQGSFFA